MLIVPDILIDTLGLPRKEKCIWKTKDRVIIAPDHPAYTTGDCCHVLCCAVMQSWQRMFRGVPAL
jgi:hypothetical protein